ncbi:MAG: hypothetical protein WDZ28_03330 [Simkaniaceae bacterium]
MSFTEEETVKQNPKALKELEEVIAKAIAKVNARKENDLCKYIPVKTGGYIHHFTLRKMKKKKPEQLSALIEKHIIKSTAPPVIPPKQRAPRGSRKRRDQLTFTKGQLERLLNMAKLAGDKEMVSLLSPKKSLAVCKRELSTAIRHGIVDQDLWNSYVESVNAQYLIAQAAASEYAPAFEE